jgi:hypothetical protein
VLQQTLAVHTPPLQVEAPRHAQQEHTPEVQAVPSGLLLVTQPPDPSQAAAVWQSLGAQL